MQAEKVAYLHNAVYNSFPALLDKSQGCDLVEHILEVAPRSRMSVYAADCQIPLCIHFTKLSLDTAVALSITVLVCSVHHANTICTGWHGNVFMRLCDNNWTCAATVSYFLALTAKETWEV